jgi:hypothetical protein
MFFFGFGLCSITCTIDPRIHDACEFRNHPFLIRTHGCTSSSPLFHTKSFLLSTERQSAKPFLQSSELGLPQPLTSRRVSPPPPPVLGGGTHTRWRKRGRESPNSDEGTYTVVLFIYTYTLCFSRIKDVWPLFSYLILPVHNHSYLHKIYFYLPFPFHCFYKYICTSYIFYRYEAHHMSPFTILT